MKKVKVCETEDFINVLGDHKYFQAVFVKVLLHET